MGIVESGNQEIRYGRGKRRVREETVRMKGSRLHRDKKRKWVTARRRHDRVSFGAPLDVPGLRNEPVNEGGVIFVFGLLAERLGFHVEAVRAAFPDCIAKRRVGTTEWQNVRIEFEYESRNFRDHRHDPEGCDVIVCWTHNWPDCPKDLEVIALSEEIKKL